MNPLTYITTTDAGKAFKRSLLLFLGFFISAFIFTACNNNKAPVSLVSQSSTNAAGNLNILYLNNTLSNPELKHLLDSSQGDVVFQFFHNKSGILALHGWPVKDTSGTYNKYDSEILHATSTPYISIAGIDVNIGNLNLGVKERDTLYADVNKAGFEFILFYPKIQVDSVKGLNHVVYDIYGGHTLPSTTNPQLMIHTQFIISGAYAAPQVNSPSGTRITSLAKPSPPYQRRP